MAFKAHAQDKGIRVGKAVSNPSAVGLLYLDMNTKFSFEISHHILKIRTLFHFVMITCQAGQKVTFGEEKIENKLCSNLRIHPNTACNVLYIRMLSMEELLQIAIKLRFSSSLLFCFRQ